MSTNKTQNLSLHAWEATDAFKREEFNENFAALDAAIGEEGVPRIVTGTYRGSGASGDGNWQTVRVGFRPKAVLVGPMQGTLAGSGALCLDGCVIGTSSVSFHPVMQIVDGGFQVSSSGSSSPALSSSGTTYLYVALG